MAFLRGKTLVASERWLPLESGCSITTTMLAKDTRTGTVFPVFTSGGGFGMKEMEGAADVLMVADPTTFRVLPWAPESGWLLCDLILPTADRCRSRPGPLSRRARTTRQPRLDFRCRVEVEFHIFKLEDDGCRRRNAGQPGTPPSVSLLLARLSVPDRTTLRPDGTGAGDHPGDVLALGLPLRSVEVEFGPSQCEFTFARPRV